MPLVSELSHLDLTESSHDADFNILGTSLYNLQETLDGELDSLFSCHIILMIFFQELSDSFR